MIQIPGMALYLTYSLKAYIGFYVHTIKHINKQFFSWYMLDIHYLTGNS